MKNWILAFILLGPMAMAAPNPPSDRSLRAVHGGIQVGFGLPRVTLSTYRPPISLTAGAFVMARLQHRFGLQLSANALTTFNMGSANGGSQKLRFNTQWLSADLLVQLQGFFQKESFFVVGFGRYDHDQLLEGEAQKIQSGGLSLALLHWQYHRNWALRTELRWHLLFEPDSQPQVLTVCLGFMI